MRISTATRIFAVVTSISNRWLLLIHAIPPKPDALRAKVGRRLARIGALPIKNSVYVLPESEEAREDLEWIRREVVEGGGECTVASSAFVGGLTDEAAIELFRRARNSDYRALLAEIQRLAAPNPARADGTAGETAATEVLRLRKRFEATSAIDFFRAAEGAEVAAALDTLERALSAPTAPTVVRPETPIRGATWVTRRDLHVDRLTSAWLIRRFIDPEAHFRFVAPDAYTPAPGEFRFDMFDGEYTHEQGGCTFETLLSHFALEEPALAAFGEIIHDLDLKDGAFGRAEAPGIALLIDGLVRTHSGDAERLRHAEPLFDVIYAALGGAVPR